MAIIYYDLSLRVPPGSPFRGQPDVEEDIEAVYSATLEAAGEDADDAPAAVGKRRKKGALPCEGQLLWYLNTDGCIREVAMHYLGSKPQLRPAFDENEGGEPCCDRCYKKSKVSPDLFGGFRVRTCTPFTEASEDSDAADDSQMPDSQMPDSEMPVSEMPVSQMADSQMPDSQMPDSQMPDSQTSAKKNGSVPRVWSAPMLGTPDKHRTS
jgi:hypothetical protein